jgi:hypothetical protein
MDGDDLDKDKEPSVSSKKGKEGKRDYHEEKWRSPHPLIPHPHINTRGDPPKLNVEDINGWQFEFRFRVCSASNELWKIIMEGYKPFNANNLNRREVVHSQLNSVALNMIQQVVASNDLSYILHFKTTKEAWEGLSTIFVGSESMKRNKFSDLQNKAEGFMKMPNEDHQEMYKFS